MSRSTQEHAQPTHEWEQIELLCAWLEQRRYEQIRPLVLFDVPVSRQSEEVGLSPSTLYRRLDAFESQGTGSLFGSERSKPRQSFVWRPCLGLTPGPPLRDTPG